MMRTLTLIGPVCGQVCDTASSLSSLDMPVHAGAPVKAQAAG